MLAPVELAQHLLTFLDAMTRPLLGAESAWFAIVLLTVLVRAALLPLAAVQARAAPAPRPPAQPVARLARLLPFAVVPVALWLPLALVVYLAAGNLCTLVQQAVPALR